MVNPKCTSYGSDIDDVEHTIFRCVRWVSMSRNLEVTLDDNLEPEAVVSLMLESREKWKAMKEFVNIDMLRKEEEERARQAIPTHNT